MESYDLFDEDASRMLENLPDLSDSNYGQQTKPVATDQTSTNQATVAQRNASGVSG